MGAVRLVDARDETRREPRRRLLEREFQGGIISMKFRVRSAALPFRAQVINLQEQLDRKLQQRQARETGICGHPASLSSMPKIHPKIHPRYIQRYTQRYTQRYIHRCV